MKKIPFRIIGYMFASLTMIVIVGLFILLAVKSLPTSKESNAIYPDPIEIQTTSPSSSAETLCDQWFAYRRELPEDKRAIAEEEYENCVSARTTPSPVGAVKPIPSAPSVGENNLSMYKRIAGSGTLLESSFSRLNSVYRISNQWFADINGNHIIVYAGGKQSETASGDALLSDLSWPGIIVVSVTDAKGNNLPERGGMFWTPQNGGPVRIVDATDTTLTVVAKSGMSFLFDVVGLRFLSAQPGPTISKSIGAGTLVESEISPYLVEAYEFVNYWYYDKKDSERISIMAGREKENPKIGILLMLISPLSDPSKVVQATSYETILLDGALRIVNVDREKITLVSENDLVYEFNVTLRQFALLPSGSDAILPMTIDAGKIISLGAGLSVSTPTPTITSSPRPTRTPLPTYDPYP